MKMFLKSCTSCFLALNLRIINLHFWFSANKTCCKLLLNVFKYLHSYKICKKKKSLGNFEIYKD